ncbi:hypothetical protein [Sulfitobacter faviae]|uniref:hypothetical protein n=1 Tax=Sulfitobacter faviae TaxID=1775881 RepID=UPI00398D0102
MSAKLIPVVPVTDATLTDSNIPEDDFAAWDSGTTYDASTDETPVKVIKGHKIWESVQGTNLDNDPEADDGTWWTDLGATNRWSAFDGYIQNQASRAGSAEWVVTPGQLTSAVSLFNVLGDSVDIVVDDPTEGVVYDETHSLTDNSNVFDGWSYFFAPIVTKDTICITDLPPYASASITVTVNNATGNAAVGQLAFGFAETIGETINEVPLGIEDYTRLNEDAFGRTSPVIRGYARTATPAISVDTYRVTYLERLLADQRGIASVWAFDTARADNELAYLGYYRSMNFIYQYAAKTTLDLEIRSLV